MIKYVRFTDETKSVVDLVFSGPQDPQFWINLGEIEEDDVRFVSFLHPELSPQMILKAKQDQKDSLLVGASQAMTPLLVSLQLGNATTDETARATAWQSYYRVLQDIDLTVTTPAWPTVPA